MKYFINNYIKREENGIRISEIYLEMNKESADFLYKNRGKYIDILFGNDDIEILINYSFISLFPNYYNLIPNTSYSLFGLDSRCLLEDLNDVESREKKVGVFEFPYFQGTIKHNYNRDSISILKDMSNKFPNPNISIRENKDLDVECSYIYDYGFLNINFNSKMINEIESISYKIYSSNNNIFPLFLGGDHTITYPIVKGINNSGYKSLRLLYFDAHLDISELEELHNGNVMKKLKESFSGDIELINFGARSPLFIEEYNNSRDLTKFTDIENLITYLKKNKNIPLYISIDLDYLDPVYNPGVTYPVPNGSTVNNLLEIIRKIFDLDVKVLGIDIVEYNSSNDLSLVGANTSAYLIYNLLKDMAKFYK